MPLVVPRDDGLFKLFDREVIIEHAGARTGPLAGRYLYHFSGASGKQPVGKLEPGSMINAAASNPALGCSEPRQ
jgi:hypothetical protein